MRECALPGPGRLRRMKAPAYKCGTPICLDCGSKFHKVPYTSPSERSDGTIRGSRSSNDEPDFSSKVSFRVYDQSALSVADVLVVMTRGRVILSGAMQFW